MEQGLHAGRVLPLSPSPHLHPCTPLLLAGHFMPKNMYADYDCVCYDQKVQVVPLTLHMLQWQLLPVPAMLKMVCRDCPVACVCISAETTAE